MYLKAIPFSIDSTCILVNYVSTPIPRQTKEQQLSMRRRPFECARLTYIKTSCHIGNVHFKIHCESVSSNKNKLKVIRSESTIVVSRFSLSRYPTNIVFSVESGDEITL